MNESHPLFKYFKGVDPEKKKLEDEKLEKEKLEKEKLEQEKLDKEKLEQEQLDKDNKDKDNNNNDNVNNNIDGGNDVKEENSTTNNGNEQKTDEKKSIVKEIIKKKNEERETISTNKFESSDFDVKFTDYVWIKKLRNGKVVYLNKKTGKMVSTAPIYYQPIPLPYVPIFPNDQLDSIITGIRWKKDAPSDQVQILSKVELKNIEQGYDYYHQKTGYNKRRRDLLKISQQAQTRFMQLKIEDLKHRAEETMAQFWKRKHPHLYGKVDEKEVEALGEEDEDVKELLKNNSQPKPKEEKPSSFRSQREEQKILENVKKVGLGLQLNVAAFAAKLGKKFEKEHEKEEKIVQQYSFSNVHGLKTDHETKQKKNRRKLLIMEGVSKFLSRACSDLDNLKKKDISTSGSSFSDNDEELAQKTIELGAVETVSNEIEFCVFYVSVYIRLFTVFIGYIACISLDTKKIADTSTLHQLLEKGVPIMGQNWPLLKSDNVYGNVFNAIFINSNTQGGFDGHILPTIKGIQAMCEQVGAQLCARYAEQIKKLTYSGAILLGECATRRILLFLQKGKVTQSLQERSVSQSVSKLMLNYEENYEFLKENPVVSQFMDAVMNVKSKQGYFKSKIIIPTKKKKLGWNETAVFKKTGIKTRVGKTFQYWANDAKDKTKASKYGFRLGTKEEALLLGYRLQTLIKIIENPHESGLKTKDKELDKLKKQIQIYKRVKKKQSSQILILKSQVQELIQSRKFEKKKSMRALTKSRSTNSSPRKRTKSKVEVLRKKTLTKSIDKGQPKNDGDEGKTNGDEQNEEPKEAEKEGVVENEAPKTATTLYSYAELIVNPEREGVDSSNKEFSLLDEDFQTVFKMTKEEWKNTPKWKRTKIKQKYNLF